MAGSSGGVGGEHESAPDIIGQSIEAYGTGTHTDTYVPEGRRTRSGERFVHRPNFGENADVRRFTIKGEAYFSKTGGSEHESLSDVIRLIDSVFAGAHGPQYPVIEYEIVDIDGEDV